MLTLPLELRNDKIRGFTDIVDAEGAPVAYLVATPDARLIVQAVNAYAGLRAIERQATA